MHHAHIVECERGLRRYAMNAYIHIQALAMLSNKSRLSILCICIHAYKYGSRKFVVDRTISTSLVRKRDAPAGMVVICLRMINPFHICLCGQEHMQLHLHP